MKLQAKSLAVSVYTPVLLSAQIDAERIPRASPKIFVFSVVCEQQSVAELMLQAFPIKIFFFCRVRC